MLGGDDAQPTGLVVLESRSDLCPGVHHERAAPGDRFPDRGAAQDDDVQRGVSRLLVHRTVDGAVVTDRTERSWQRPGRAAHSTQDLAKQCGNLIGWDWGRVESALSDVGAG